MSAIVCGGSQTASACRCSANSPFRWAERADCANTGANTPMQRARPANNKAWAEQQVAKLLKPATFAVYSKARPSSKKGA